MHNTTGMDLLTAAAAITEGETSLIANLANLSALIYLYTERINWAGFYLMEGGELVLGPFQGKPACTRIAAGAGVCGAAVLRQATVVVDDVRNFPGHIACDADSRSELVVPIIIDNGVIGVLDIDSPVTHRFTNNDRVEFERLVQIIQKLHISPR